MDFDAIAEMLEQVKQAAQQGAPGGKGIPLQVVHRTSMAPITAGEAGGERVGRRVGSIVGAPLGAITGSAGGGFLAGRYLADPSSPQSKLLRAAIAAGAIGTGALLGTAGGGMAGRMAGGEVGQAVGGTWPTKTAATKCRSGLKPIRAHNLTKRSKVDKSRSQLKTAAAAQVAKSGLAKKLLKPAAVFGGSVAAWETGKQALRDYQMGRAYRKQMEQAQRRG